MKHISFLVIAFCFITCMTHADGLAPLSTDIVKEYLYAQHHKLNKAAELQQQGIMGNNDLLKNFANKKLSEISILDLGKALPQLMHTFESVQEGLKIADDKDQVTTHVVE